MPAVTQYRYKASAPPTVVPQPRKEAECKAMYRDLVARLALRAVAEAFAVSPPSLVDVVAFNGHVHAKDRATGKAIRPCLISLRASRGTFEDLVLDEPELDPVQSLHFLNAIVSQHPYDLEPVRPVVTFDLAKYKLAPERDVVAGLDSRPDLVALDPIEFEHLIRRLFEKIGLKSWVTQASRDDGVDAVAVNEEPSSAACASSRPNAPRTPCPPKLYAHSPASCTTKPPPKASSSPPHGSVKPAGTSPTAPAAWNSSTAATSKPSSSSTSASTHSSAYPNSHPAGKPATSPDADRLAHRELLVLARSASGGPGNRQPTTTRRGRRPARGGPVAANAQQGALGSAPRGPGVSAGWLAYGLSAAHGGEGGGRGCEYGPGGVVPGRSASRGAPCRSGRGIPSDRTADPRAQNHRCASLAQLSSGISLTRLPEGLVTPGRRPPPLDNLEVVLA